jgi:predicted ATPase/DNA-binding SARP family transcriptional activator
MGSEFRILGTVEVLQEGDLVNLGSPRQRALLTRLLISPGRLITTDRLVDDLWSGDAPETAWHAIHVYVSGLRQALGPDRDKLERRGSGYLLSIGPDELDAARFERLAAEGRAARARRDPDRASAVLREALAIWRGPALADLAHEVFAREEALRLEELRLTVLEARIWADLELAGHGELVEELQDLVVQHPFRETFWEQLMVALYGSNRQVDALRVYQNARTKLAEELGIEPGPALRRMEERILAQDPSLDPMGGAPPVIPPSKMPMQRTSFIGRKRELAQGRTLLEASRLLTLTGAPGSGKTRLALRLAADRHDAFPHGSFFVPLAAVSNPRLVCNVIVRTLGLREVRRETALESVSAFLHDRTVLLVLDNFEQIIGAATQVGELLDAAPDLKIVVTSRSALGISGEQEFPVPPLQIPSLDDLPDLETLSSIDAVALFVTRARATIPDFCLDDSNAAAVAEITASLDGLPLAIELAAAQIKFVTPHELLSKLEGGLTVLTGGPADTADRHGAMRDAIAWSYELLEPEEQVLFRRLGVFRGGFTLEAAAEIANRPGLDIFEGVTSLLSKSLLTRPVNIGRARFAMLQMIREFAREQLGSTGEIEEITSRHGAYFLRLAQEIEPQLTHESHGTAIERLSSEVDNLREALDNAPHGADPDFGINLASCIWRFWQSTDQLTEGRDWLEELLNHPGASAEARANGLTALAGLAYWQADYDEALARYSEALDLYRTRGDRFNEADTLCSMSLTANWQRDLDASDRLAESALSIFEELGAREEVGKVLMAQAGALWFRGEHAPARKLFEESHAISRQYGDLTLALTQLAGLASLTFQMGDWKEALRIVVDGINEAAQLHNVHITVWMLDLVAAFSASRSPEEAVRLAGAVDSLRREAGGGVLTESLDIADARTVASGLLSAERAEGAWLEGGEMSLEQAVEQAHALAELGLGSPEEAMIFPVVSPAEGYR